MLEEDILPYFKIGYELQKGTSGHYWDDLELFMSYRAAHVVMALTQINECGITDTLDRARKMFAYLLMEKDGFQALDGIRAQIRAARLQ